MFKDLLIKTIQICNKELANRKNGILGESTEEQLTKIIIPELEQLKEMIDTNQLVAKEQRYLISFAYAFKVWGWNMQEPSELFSMLAKLNNEYKTLP